MTQAWAPVLALLSLGAAAPEAGPANCVPNGDFEAGREHPEHWRLPEGGRAQWAEGEGAKGSRALRVTLDRATAESYGQGCFSPALRLEPDREYQVSVDVRSDGPNVIVFVKGFATIRGKEREIYTKHKELRLGKDLERGRFRTVRYYVQPRHPSYRIERVKLWLYAYLRPGRAWFDNVRIVEKGAPPPKPRGERGGAVPIAPVPPDPEREAHPPIPVDIGGDL